MYKIEFSNEQEIRMGSLYNIADVKISGDYVPDISGYDFQDKSLISGDGKICYLVQWETINNEPGFIVWKLDSANELLSKSQRVEGCCDSLTFDNNKVIVTSWSYDSNAKKSITNSQTIDI